MDIYKVPFRSEVSGELALKEQLLLRREVIKKDLARLEFTNNQILIDDRLAFLFELTI